MGKSLVSCFFDSRCSSLWGRSHAASGYQYTVVVCCNPSCITLRSMSNVWQPVDPASAEAAVFSPLPSSSSSSSSCLSASASQHAHVHKANCQSFTHSVGDIGVDIANWHCRLPEFCWQVDSKGIRRAVAPLHERLRFTNALQNCE